MNPTRRSSGMDGNETAKMVWSNMKRKGAPAQQGNMRSFRPENRAVEDGDMASVCGCPAASPTLFSPFLSTKPSIPLFRDLRDELGYVDQRQEVLPTRGRSAGLSKAQLGSGKPILY